ncbi:MAG: carboxylesterase family protein [Vicinamibacteria bacterium]
MRGPLVDRRGFLVHAAALAGAAAVAPRGAFAQAGTTEYVEVKTPYGRLRGRRDGDLVTFKGVPYAGPVAGANRFKAAPPLQPWTGVRDALQLAPPSCQPGRDYYGVDEPAPDESCLFLNVWTPALDGHRRPVMFFNHGGGFTSGSGGSVDCDGGNLARRHDVVVVQTNHRLGLLGYLFLGDVAGEEYATSGNQGLLDMRNGLRWVHDSIEAFGGDPANVMIFGESGGGAKTSCLYALPSAAPYFHKAAIESGPGVRMMPRDAATETAVLTLQQLGLDRTQWRRLLDVPAADLVAAQVALARRPGGRPRFNAGRGGLAPRAGSFGPVVDGVVLPQHPFDPVAPEISRHKPLLIGTNRDESAFMFMGDPTHAVFELTDATLRGRLERELGKDTDAVLATYRETRPGASPADLYIAITSATMFWLGSLTVAERKHAQGGAPVYMYMLTYPSDWVIPGTSHRLGAAHATDLLYTFDNVYPDGQWPPQGKATMYQMLGGGAGRFAVARSMSALFTSFARSSEPSAKGAPHWPPYTSQTRSTMMIDTECKIADDPFAKERLLWAGLRS